MSEVNCICCDKVLQVDENSDTNPIVVPSVYGGLVFRSSGNYGSTIFDPFPSRQEQMLQVIICDECIKDEVEWVTRIYNIHRNVIADAEPFDIDRR